MHGAGRIRLTPIRPPRSFTWTAGGNPDRARRFPSSDNHVLHGLFAGAYLQDEWKILPKLTLNYGARFDVFYSSFDNENQLSPRVNLIYQPTDSTTLHAGYARYFTPPPVENVPAATWPCSTARRMHPPIDAGQIRSRPSARIISTPASARKSRRDCKVGVDGYYKTAQHQLDDGLFGQTLILSAFNYAKGRVYGVEFTGYLRPRRLLRLCQCRLLGGAGRRTGIRRSSCLIRMTWLMSKITGFIWTTTRRVTGSFGMSYTWKEGPTPAARSFMRTRSTAADCGRTAADDRSRRQRPDSQRRDRAGLLLHQPRCGAEF